MDSIKTGCDQCGSCCMSGGPALHSRDRELVLSGRLSLDDLITVRKGELVMLPLTEEPVASEGEFVKIQGVGSDWCCKIYSRNPYACTIYESRPLACKTLKCWDPEEILQLAGKDLLTRFDCIAEDDPLLPLVTLHNEQCPIPVFDEIRAKLDSVEERENTLADLSRLVNSDLQLRASAASRHQLSVARELFYFGRPLFQLLTPVGITWHESPTGLVLGYNPS